MFPADNIWNVPIDTLPLAKKSAAYLKVIGLSARVHPDFGKDPSNGFPVMMVTSSTPTVNVKFLYDDQSDHVPYPIPDDVLTEGGPTSTGDRHIVLVNESDCMLYELWDTHKTDKGWTAGSGIKMSLKSNDLRKDGDTSGDAAGLPILPGLLRYDEVQTGKIEHAIRFTIPKTQHAHVWPARHDASNITDPNTPPLGIRMRLRADFDMSTYSKTNRTILKAMQKYGLFLADNGSAIYITGVTDPRWNDDDLHKLTQIMGSDFEVVDETDLQVNDNSAAADLTKIPAAK